MNDVKLRSSSLTRHTCQASSISYIGDCPILSCPANMIRLSHGVMVGCAFDVIGPRVELNALPSALKLTQKEVKLRYSNGFRNLSKMTELMNLLMVAREPSSNNRDWWSCPRCGVMKSTFGQCLNKSRCTERRNLVRRSLSCHPLNTEGLDITPSEFWILLKRQIDDTGAYKYINSTTEEAGRELMERLT